MESTRKVIVLIAATVVGITCAAAAAQPVVRPNIVLILCDDLGYGDIHAFNPERGRIPTPNVDRLADEGMMFTDAHSSSAVCTPTRYSILTGRYGWRSRLQSGVLGGMAEPLIAADCPTVASFLHDQGYATACLGKWHLGLRFGPDKFASPVVDGPLEHGFDYFFGIAASLDMPPFAWIEDRRFPEAPTAKKRWNRSGPAAPSFEAVDVMPTLTSKAREYIRKHGNAQDQPFFLYLALTAPHTPIVPTAEWKATSGLGDYADFVCETDAAVGEVLTAINDADLRDNTVVFFASDNGCAPAAKPHDLEARGHFPSAQFRGYKADIWEGGHRIPLVVRWPGVVAAGSKSPQLIGLIDLFATTADILQQQLPDNAAVDSFSMLPILKGGDSAVRMADIHHSIDGRFSVREGNWKLALCAGSGGWSAPRDPQAAARDLPKVQLFDLAADPGETHNVEAEYPEVVDRLTRYLERSIAAGRTTPGPRQKNDVPVEIYKRAARAAKPGNTSRAASD